MRSEHLLDRVAQVLPVDAIRSELLEDVTEGLTEVRDDLLAHIELRGRRKACDRSGFDPFPRRELPDEACRVEVVGAEIVAPLRDAVGFVEHPRSDLALTYGCLEGTAAQLLGRDVKERELPEPYAFENVVALGHGEETVQRGGETARPGLAVEVLDLVLHQRLKRRDDHGERSGPFVMDDCGQLVAERLAATGRQDRKKCPPFHAPGDDPLLKAFPVARRRGRSELRKLEVPFEVGARIVVYSAILAVRVLASGAAHRVQEARGGGESTMHPAR